MDNWGGSRWTTKRRPRKFFGKSKQLIHDEIGRDSRSINLGHRRSDIDDYKTHLESQIKKRKIKNIIIGIVIIPAFCILFIIGKSVYSSFNDYATEQSDNSKLYQQEHKIYKNEAYNHLVYSGNIAMEKNEYELALKSGKGTIEIYENLALACIMTCDLYHANCDKIEKYEAKAK